MGKVKYQCTVMPVPGHDKELDSEPAQAPSCCGKPMKKVA